MTTYSIKHNSPMLYSFLDCMPPLLTTLDSSIYRYDLTIDTAKYPDTIIFSFLHSVAVTWQICFYGMWGLQYSNFGMLFIFFFLLKNTLLSGYSSVEYFFSLPYPNQRIMQWAQLELEDWCPVCLPYSF